MNTFTELKNVLEEGFSAALTAREDISKCFFLKALMVIENIENTPQPTKEESMRRTYKNVMNKEDTYTIAYFLSEYGHEPLFQGEHLNQSKTIEKLAKLLDIAPNTLRNYRDVFDRYTNSPRQGWDKEMNEGQERIFKECKQMDKDTLLQKLNTILYIK